VLAATEELLAEGAPYFDLRIERIASRAGISRTAFYFYFRDKRELLMRLTADVADLLYQQAEIWFTGDGGDPEDEFREALTNIAALYDEHGVLLRAMVEVATYDDEVAEAWHALLGRFVAAARARIEAEQGAGRAVAQHAHATAFALCWMTEHALYQHSVEGRPFATGDMVEALVGIWRRSVYGA